jgi:ribosomal protein S27E
MYTRSTRQGNELSSQLSVSSLGSIYAVETLVNSLQRVVDEYSLYVNNEFSGYNSELLDIEGDLRIAESTMELLREHSFKWKQGESPVLAIKAHHLDKDIHGILTLTNLRIIFEEEREEVLKKILFIATEKKWVREIIIDQPVGAVESLRSGSVGFFKGAGLYIKFKDDSGGGEVRLDTKGNEGERVSRFYEYIMTGSADEVLGEEEAEEFKPVVCPHCSAPYNEEVYRGQTIVECKYCGTVISL